MARTKPLRPPEFDTALEHLWKQGLSTANIAEALAQQFQDAAVTKNVVIGRAHRLGLSARAVPHSIAARVAKAIEEGKPVAKAVRKPRPPAPPAGRTCEWIEGDPIKQLRRGVDPHCGKPVDSDQTYCDAHAPRVYDRHLAHRCTDCGQRFSTPKGLAIHAGINHPGRKAA